MTSFVCISILNQLKENKFIFIYQYIQFLIILNRGLWYRRNIHQVIILKLFQAKNYILQKLNCPSYLYIPLLRTSQSFPSTGDVKKIVYPSVSFEIIFYIQYVFLPSVSSAWVFLYYMFAIFFLRQLRRITKFGIFSLFFEKSTAFLTIC